jgi:hypothetical protein
METILVVIICIISIILIKLIVEYNIDTFDNTSGINKKANLKILLDDLEYYKKFNKSKKIDSLINVNKLKSSEKKKNRILFVTFDNRKNQEYVKIHNSNIEEYVNKFGYEYKFYTTCDKNVYWCKIHFVLEALETNQYDYVVWLDSDTVIKKFDIDIGDIFNMFSSDIFVGSDNHTRYGIINAGVFAIANTEIGTGFLYECINYINTDCFNADGTLKGRWAGTCYEQGVMNILIHDKYYPNTTVLTNRVIFNYNVCSDDVFIMHLYGSTPESRIKCFQSKNTNK